MQEQASQLARQLYDRHTQIQVSDALLDDLVVLYASEALDDDDVEAFVERMAEESYKAAIRLDFCHCAMAVNAALHLTDEDVYKDFVALLDLGEEDEMLAEMKRFILRKLADDALDTVEDTQRFEQWISTAQKTI